MTDTWWCEHAWLGDDSREDPADGVLFNVSDGRITAINTDTTARPGSKRLRGLVIPGLANAHSHAFHRALRARTQRDRGSFWTWRDLMYRAAERLNPDRYRRLTRAVYAEMALAGITSVGEFHYVHHDSGGTHYAEPNAMGEAVIDGAADGGIRLTLLDTCYLSLTAHRWQARSSGSATAPVTGGPSASKHYGSRSVPNRPFWSAPPSILCGECRSSTCLSSWNGLLHMVFRCTYIRRSRPAKSSSAARCTAGRRPQCCVTSAHWGRGRRQCTPPT